MRQLGVRLCPAYQLARGSASKHTRTFPTRTSRGWRPAGVGAHVYEKQIVCVGICGPLPPTLAALSLTAFPSSWLVFSSHGNHISHGRTVTVVTRSSVQLHRAWCKTLSLLNNPTATTPILQLWKPRMWEVEILKEASVAGGFSEPPSSLAPGYVAILSAARGVRSALYPHSLA